MKKILTLICSFLAINAFSQTSNSKLTDTNYVVKVIYATQQSKSEPAYFLNGKLVAQSILAMLNPKDIEDVQVAREKIEIKGSLYEGQILIKTKANYVVKAISLMELKKKYTNLKDKSAIFMIDGNLINTDSNEYMIDENNLFTIIVDSFNNKAENINLGLIKILTKSDENIRKSKEIRIRGSEISMNN